MPVPLVVLDTNVVLDWFVFRNPGVDGVARAVEQGAIGWVGCAAMRAELAHVLTHAQLGGHVFDIERVLTSVNRLMSERPTPATLSLARPRCTDPDDQMFVDLALAYGARWLLSRDRALLKLARKTATRGLAILRPEHWPGVPA